MTWGRNNKQRQSVPQPETVGNGAGAAAVFARPVSRRGGRPAARSLEDAETMFPATRMPDLIDVHSVRAKGPRHEALFGRNATGRVEGPPLIHPAVHRVVSAMAPGHARPQREGALEQARRHELLRLSPGRAGTLDLDVASDPLRAFLVSQSRALALRATGGAVPRLERVGVRRYTLLERTLNAAEVGPVALCLAVFAIAAVVYGGVAAYANERREIAAPQLSGQSVTEWASDLRRSPARAVAAPLTATTAAADAGAPASNTPLPGMISMPEVTVPEVAPPADLRHLPLKLDIQGDG